jgi:hypothetical protein
VAVKVHDRDDADHTAHESVEDSVRKLFDDRSPDIRVNLREGSRVLNDCLEPVDECNDESLSQARALKVVIVHDLPQIAASVRGQSNPLPRWQSEVSLEELRLEVIPSFPRRRVCGVGGNSPVQFLLLDLRQLENN